MAVASPSLVGPVPPSLTLRSVAVRCLVAPAAIAGSVVSVPSPPLSAVPPPISVVRSTLNRRAGLHPLALVDGPLRGLLVRGAGGPDPLDPLTAPEFLVPVARGHAPPEKRLHLVLLELVLPDWDLVGVPRLWPQPEGLLHENLLPPLDLLLLRLPLGLARARDLVLRLGLVVPKDVAAVLPASHRGLDRVPEVALSVLVRLDVLPVELVPTSPRSALRTETVAEHAAHLLDVRPLLLFRVWPVSFLSPRNVIRLEMLALGFSCCQSNKHGRISEEFEKAVPLGHPKYNLGLGMIFKRRSEHSSAHSEHTPRL